MTPQVFPEPETLPSALSSQMRRTAQTAQALAASTYTTGKSRSPKFRRLISLIVTHGETEKYVNCIRMCKADRLPPPPPPDSRSKEQEAGKRDMDVNIAPLRAWDDFFPGSDRFARPDFRDISKWNNRVVSNLLYYQTNYLVVAAMMISVVGEHFRARDLKKKPVGCISVLQAFTINRFLSPFNMILGGIVVVLVFTGFVWAAHNKDILRRMKKQYPTTFVMVVMLASYFLISMFGGVMVFVFGITFPLLLMFIHASLRLRNLKNKLENKMEGIGLKRTPMGIVLDALEQQEESISKFTDYISKVKE
ncbi:hypothetical protein EI555_017700 [Monodon monoceros]|nr:hypothetical protein EI555_017700 [Monodon monoceros]